MENRTLYGPVRVYEYGPFGEVIRSTEPMAKSNPFRFSTKFQDNESDLIYYGFRYYSSAPGRWLSPDPQGEAQGVNVLAFGRNDLLNGVDYRGLAFIHSVTLAPRLFNRPLAPYRGATYVTHGQPPEPGALIETHTSPCSCGTILNEYRLYATIREEFSESEQLAQLWPIFGAQSDIQHEDSHAIVFRDYLSTISDGARVIYGRCVTENCYGAWNNWWFALRSFAESRMDLAHHQIDFDDPLQHGATVRQEQLDEEALMVQQAQSLLIDLARTVAENCQFLRPNAAVQPSAGAFVRRE